MMVKKMYEEPSVLVVELEVEDIICSSIGDGDNFSPWGLSDTDAANID